MVNGKRAEEMSERAMNERLDGWFDGWAGSWVGDFLAGWLGGWVVSATQDYTRTPDSPPSPAFLFHDGWVDRSTMPEHGIPRWSMDGRGTRRSAPLPAMRAHMSRFTQIRVELKHGTIAFLPVSAPGPESGMAKTRNYDATMKDQAFVVWM